MLTYDEVVWGYRYVLGRDPESAQVIDNYAQRPGDWQQLRQTLLRSPEFSRKFSLISISQSRWVAADILQRQRLIWLDLSDQYVSRGCLFDNYEPLESALLREHIKPGHVVLDIGANIGWFTLLASTLVGEKGHIHAFEPRHPTVDYLQRSIAMNGLHAQVTVHDFGLDNVEGDRRLGWLKGTPNPGHSELIENAAGNFETISIRVKALDQLQLGRVDFIKIDVEGAEMRVLEGGRETIEANRPIILAEVFPEQLQKVSNVSTQDFFSWFSSRHYDAFLIDAKRNGEKIDAYPANWPKELLNVILIPQSV